MLTLLSVNVKDFEKSKESTDFCQTLLASCWRSHKYVSAIFYIIITKVCSLIPLQFLEAFFGSQNKPLKK